MPCTCRILHVRQGVRYDPPGILCSVKFHLPAMGGLKSSFSGPLEESLHFCSLTMTEICKKSSLTMPTLSSAVVSLPGA